MAGEDRAVFEEPLEAFVEAGQRPDGFLLEHLNRDQRQQADEGARFQAKHAVVMLDLVVVKAVGVVPKAGAAEGVHGVGDLDEVLEELGGHVLVGGVGARAVAGQFERDAQHGQAIEGHPGGAVGLLQGPAVRERLRAIEDADVVEAEEAAGEEVLALGVLAVDPPGEVEQEFLEDPFEEGAIAGAGPVGDFIHAPGSPGVDGRVHVVEGEFVGGELAVGVEIPFAQEQQELALGEGRIEPREEERVEGEIPGGLLRRRLGVVAPSSPSSWAKEAHGQGRDKTTRTCGGREFG